MSPRARLLLVEDELIIAKSLAQNLEKAGYEVVEMASSEKEALAAVERNVPDVILMDIRIKGPHDGVHAAQEINQRFQIPIIFLTAHGDRETLNRAQESEPFGFLVKPVSILNLITAIETAVTKHALVRRLEQSEMNLLKANQALEQFAYAAAHDLQEPLRNIALATDMLSVRFKDHFDGPGNELLQLAKNDATRMQEMVKDLLAYSRPLESDDLAGALADANLVLLDALANLQTAISEKSAIITHDTLPAVRMRDVHLLQLFQNLLSNSLKYSGTATPVIHVTSMRKEAQLVFAVRDNGLGIPGDQHQRAFGMFKRLHGREQAGTGIGLALCKRIVEHYGGKIWIESNEGVGITILFTPPAG